MLGSQTYMLHLILHAKYFFSFNYYKSTKLAQFFSRRCGNYARKYKRTRYKVELLECARLELEYNQPLRKNG